jgi:hypothetical protein
MWIHLYARSKSQYCKAFTVRRSIIKSELTWVASLVSPTELKGHRALGASFGWTVLVEGPHQVMYRDDRGTVIEYCTPEHAVPDYLFQHQVLVIGFLVADIDEALTMLPVEQSRPIGPRTAAGDVEFQHVQRHDGTIFALIANID